MDHCKQFRCSSINIRSVFNSISVDFYFYIVYTGIVSRVVFVLESIFNMLPRVVQISPRFVASLPSVFWWNLRQRRNRTVR